jgi:histidinol-phosphate aminotransferase
MSGYVPGEQPRDQQFVKLNTNENPYPCSPRVKAAVGRAITEGLQRYPDPLATSFRELAAEVHRAELPQITPDWILCGNGSDDLLTILTRCFVGPGQGVRFPRPSYVLYATLAALQEAFLDVVDFDAAWRLGERFSEPDPRVRLALLPNPNSPSGTMMAPAEVAAVADALPCPLVVDEAYVDFADANCLPLVGRNERVIVTRSMSKSYGLAGLRFGYAVAQPQVIEQMIKVKDSYNCDALSIAGATAALGDREWFAANRAAVLASRARLDEELARLGFAGCPSQANFLWRRHAEQPSAALYSGLKELGVLVRYMNYGDWGDGLRITVGSDPQIDVLLDRLRRLVPSR